jgi:uncharacterized protein YndB with AHSA1/START domain
VKEPFHTISVTITRTISALPDEVCEAWLDPKIPGNPWNSAETLLLDPKVDGLFYWRKPGIYHHGYGRFTTLDRPARIEHTWVSPDTLGTESVVNVTFKEQGGKTLMTLIHSNLPDTEEGRSQEIGWNIFLDIFPKQFENKVKNDE